MEDFLNKHILRVLIKHDNTKSLLQSILDKNEQKHIEMLYYYFGIEDLELKTINETCKKFHLSITTARFLIHDTLIEYMDKLNECYIVNNSKMKINFFEAFEKTLNKKMRDYFGYIMYGETYDETKLKFYSKSSNLRSLSVYLDEFLSNNDIMMPVIEKNNRVSEEKKIEKREFVDFMSYYKSNEVQKSKKNAKTSDAKFNSVILNILTLPEFRSYSTKYEPQEAIVLYLYSKNIPFINIADFLNILVEDVQAVICEYIKNDENVESFKFN